MIKELDKDQLKILQDITMQYAKNQDLLSCEEILEDENKLRYLNNENSKLIKIVDLYNKYSSILAEYKALDTYNSDDELKQLVKATKMELENRLQEITGEITCQLNKYSENYNNIVVELIYKSYNQLQELIYSAIINICKNNNYNYTVDDEENSIIKFNISGYGCYDKLFSLSGINKDDKLNFVTIIIYTQEKLRFFNQSDDIKIAAYRSSGAGGQNINKLSTAIRVTHIPTNITLINQDERTQLQNKNKALESLKLKVNAYYKKMYDDEIKKQKVTQLKNVSRGTISNLFDFANNKISGIINMSISEFEKGNI